MATIFSLIRSKPFWWTLVAVGGALSISGCTTKQEAPADPSSTQPSESSEWNRGIVDLYPKMNSDVRGTLVIKENPQGLQITGHLEALESSSYAISMHVQGDCSAHDAKSVGKVFNPTQSEPPAGLLGDAVGDENSKKSEVELIAPNLHINGDDSVLGRAIVVHAWPTDPQVDWQRVPFFACGVIEAG